MSKTPAQWFSHQPQLQCCVVLGVLADASMVIRYTEMEVLHLLNISMLLFVAGSKA